MKMNTAWQGQRRRRGELGTESVGRGDELAADRTRADEANRKHEDATESTTPAGNVCEGWKRCGAEDDGGYGERRGSGQCGMEETRVEHGADCTAMADMRRCLGNLAGHGQRLAMRQGELGRFGEGFEVMVLDFNSKAEEARLLVEDGDEGGWDLQLSLEVLIIAAVEKADFADKMSNISTVGDTSLKLLEGKALPVVHA
ncbi:hypothetical protein M0R45_030935 [Rubus argutus]|uniref:phosphoglycerate kinase n=1 Tax=Rubus argutus TaxID=59490 RepID=A0AAW1WGJ9_RUBAR